MILNYLKNVKYFESSKLLNQCHKKKIKIQ